MQPAQPRKRALRRIGRGAPVVRSVATAIDSVANPCTFTAGVAGFGTGCGARGSLADLKIVPGQAILLAGDAVSAETVS